MHVFKNALASNQKFIYTIMAIYNMCIPSVCMKGVSNCFIFFLKGEGNLLPNFADHTYSTMESICISPIWELLYSRLHTVMNNLSIQQQLYAQISLKSLDSSLISLMTNIFQAIYHEKWKILSVFITQFVKIEWKKNRIRFIWTVTDCHRLSLPLAKRLLICNIHIARKSFLQDWTRSNIPFPVPHLFINFKVSFYECIYLFVCNWWVWCIYCTIYLLW